MESIRRVFLPFWGMSSLKWHVSDPILRSSRWLVVALGWFVVRSKWPKIGLQEFRIRPEVRVLRLSGAYRMSEDGVYPSSVPSFRSDVEFEVASFKSNFEIIEVARCSIGVVRGAIQVAQNWFTGIPNPSRRRVLRLSGVYRMSEDGVYP